MAHSGVSVGWEASELNLFFKDLMYDRQATATLAYTYYGGADLGECLTTTQRIHESDAEGWYR